MATAKIATLAIRTLAKPIATQIKHQAQSHQRFRSVCIALAQFMHRTEMALRSNLLAGSSGSGEKAKVRPLNEAKAVTNGANALAEGFLFALAAALIMGESYRGSRSRAKQRDKTEDGLEELSMVTKVLAEKVGINYNEIEKRVKEMQQVQEAVRESEQGNDHKAKGSEFKEEEEHLEEKSRLAATLQETQSRLEREQHAVSVLLRLALKSGWIQGQEALHLQSILDGTDEDDKESNGKQEKPMQQSSILTQLAKAQTRQDSTSS